MLNAATDSAIIGFVVRSKHLLQGTSTKHCPRLLADWAVEEPERFDSSHLLLFMFGSAQLAMSILELLGFL